MDTVKLTVYYDESCRFCRSEMASICAVAPAGVLELVDCSPADFDDSFARPQGISRNDMMNALHVKDSAGHWYKGVDAFIQLYNHGGLPKIADMWAHPLARAVMSRVYPWIVRHRYRLSRLGMPAVTEAIIGFYARRAQKQSRRCENDQCSIGK